MVNFRTETARYSLDIDLTLWYKIISEGHIIFLQLFLIDKHKHMFYTYFCKKKKPTASSVLAHLHNRLFQTHTYKLIVQNGLEFETQQICYAELLLHIFFRSSQVKSSISAISFQIIKQNNYIWAISSVGRALDF